MPLQLEGKRKGKENSQDFFLPSLDFLVRRAVLTVVLGDLGVRLSLVLAVLIPSSTPAFSPRGSAPRLLSEASHLQHAPLALWGHDQVQRGLLEHEHCDSGTARVTADEAAR